MVAAYPMTLLKASAVSTLRGSWAAKAGVTRRTEEMTAAPIRKISLDKHMREFLLFCPTRGLCLFFLQILPSARGVLSQLNASALLYNGNDESSLLFLGIC